MSSSPTSEVNVPTAKRASSRVRRQPETIYNSSPLGSAKRKRDGGEQSDVDADMDEDASDDPSEEDEPDEEEMREQRARSRKTKASTAKKPAQKKPRVNGATSLPIRSAAGAARKRPPRKVKQFADGEAEEAGGLFADVFAHGKTIDKVASDWLAAFKHHESRALGDVINFVLKSAGCNSKVTEHDIEDPDGATGRLQDLQEEYQASNPTDYPIMGKTKGSVAFKESATNFMETLIRSIAADGLLYSNTELLENIQVWLSSMSSAVNRSFRHTATAFSLSVITALCQVAKENAQQEADRRRHAQTEAKKKRANKARVAQLEQQAKDSAQAQAFLIDALNDWFDTIFIHRYRDIDPNIRRDCVAALGEWIVTMPDVFFDGSHLRYLGWVLSDAAAPTRAEVVVQLKRFYAAKDMLGGLKTFTERFRVRMVEIATADADSGVRALGIELLDLLRESGLLEPDDVDAVGRLVFDSDVKVRKAVAHFVAENVSDAYSSKIDDLGGTETLEEVLPDADEAGLESPRLEWIKLKSLAELLAVYDSEEELPNQVVRSRGDGGLALIAEGAASRFLLAAESLYDTIPELQEWQVLSGYLLFDHSSGRANGVANDTLAQFKHECILSEKEETILLELLHTSVRRTLESMAEKLTSGRAKLSKKQKTDIRDEEEEAARELASLIPKLLRKFGSSPTSAAAVLRLESVFALPLLRELRQDSATVSALLDDIKKQFMAHGTDDVLAPATSAILQAKSYGDLDDVTEEKVAGLWEDVITNLAELLDASTVIVRGASTYEELVALSNNLLRIVRLATVSDCSQALEDQAVASTNAETGVEYKAAIDYLIGLTMRAAPSTGPAPDADDAALEDEVASRASEAALFYFRWKLKAIIENVTSPSGTDIPYEELEALANRRDAYVSNLESVLNARKPAEAISHHLAMTLLDMSSSASTLQNVKPQPGISDDYTVLSMKLLPACQRSIMRVFAAFEKAYAKLSGKRLEEQPATELDGEDEDDDPMSDPESDDEDEPVTQPHTQSQAFQQNRDAQLLKALLAEQKLCSLAGKLIYAIAASIVDADSTRNRLERNRSKLGANYKEVMAYLDVDKMQKSGKGKPRVAAKRQPSAGPAQQRSKAGAKSNAIVAEDEEEDEIEEVDDDADDEDALRRRELADEPEDEEQDAGIE